MSGQAEFMDKGTSSNFKRIAMHIKFIKNESESLIKWVASFWKKQICRAYLTKYTQTGWQSGNSKSFQEKVGPPLAFWGAWGSQWIGKWCKMGGTALSVLNRVGAGFLTSEAYIGFGLQFSHTSCLKKMKTMLSSDQIRVWDSRISVWGYFQCPAMELLKLNVRVLDEKKLHQTAALNLWALQEFRRTVGFKKKQLRPDTYRFFST